MFVRYKTSGDVIANDLALANKISEISGREGLTSYQNEHDWAQITGVQCDDMSFHLIEKYNIEFVIENKQYPGGFFAYGKTYYSRFYISLHDERYKIYENSDVNIWFVYHTGG
jgi:hypothetical protein